MYSNPRMLTYENAPINTGIKSVYPELSHWSVKKRFQHEQNKKSPGHRRVWWVKLCTVTDSTETARGALSGTAWISADQDSDKSSWTLSRASTEKSVWNVYRSQVKPQIAKISSLAIKVYTILFCLWIGEQLDWMIEKARARWSQVKVKKGVEHWCIKKTVFYILILRLLMNILKYFLL